MKDKLRKNKYVRCLLLECNMRNLMLAVIALIIGIAIQFSYISSQKKELSRVRNEQTLVMRMSQKRDVLIAESTIKRPELLDKIPLKKKSFIIKGIIRNDGAISILINKSIYSVGDQIGNYTIIRINEDSAELRDSRSKAIRKLYFPDDI